MIVEQPVINLLKFEVWDAGTRAWRDLKAKATSVTMRRGGSRDGAATTMTVGTLEAVLYGGIDLATETALKPNSPIRVMRFGTPAGGVIPLPAPEFTGTLSDIAQTIALDPATGNKGVYTTLYAVDAVQSLANTDRYGALSGNGLGYETWPDRITRLSGSALVPVKLPSREDEVTFQWNATDLSQVNGSTGNSTSQGAYSTPSYLAGTFSFQGGDAPAMRARYVRTGSQVAWAFSPFISQYYYMSGLKVGQPYNARITVTAAVMTRAVSGTFTLKAKDARVATISESSPVVFAQAGDTYTIGITFIATTSTAFVTFSANDPSSFTSDAGVAEFAIDGRDFQVTKVDDPNGYKLQDVAYEASLVNHYDLACNSVGARWWVDKAGTVQFRRKFDLTTPVVTFSDKRGAALSYTDVDLAYDTRNLVNSLQLAQHGYNPATGETNDVDLAYQAPASIRRWGAHASTIDTSLYNAPGLDDATARRAREIMSTLGTPIYNVNKITWNAQQSPGALASIDLFSVVGVEYSGLVQTARVVAMTHTITPTRWLVDLEFTDIRAGKSYADFYDRYQGLTYAQFAALWKGKTYQQFDANPTG